ncbi:hypothetical protein [Natrinema caseinilyticum]|uniref:hypothetical protein n=1 Tax=Natrinema caseinilyticum TaxID=2961570 RepID=UPI0020C23873|nr:hypothetical protein [Natrinema caseinilyticum]
MDDRLISDCPQFLSVARFTQEFSNLEARWSRPVAVRRSAPSWFATAPRRHGGNRLGLELPDPFVEVLEVRDSSFEIGETGVELCEVVAHRCVGGGTVGCHWNWGCETAWGIGIVGGTPDGAAGIGGLAAGGYGFRPNPQGSVASLGGRGSIARSSGGR